MTRGLIHKSTGLAVSLLMVGGAFVMLAAGLKQEAQPQADQPAQGEVQGVAFLAFDVFVDVGENELAAWQIEYDGSSESGEVLLVGIEGGDHAAYATPPHYDPEALAGGRVILAAYSVGEELPRGKTRVARLHLRVPAADAGIQNGLNHAVTLIAAGDAAGERLTGRAWVQRIRMTTTDQADDAESANPNQTTDEETDDNLGGETNSTGDDT